MKFAIIPLVALFCISSQHALGANFDQTHALWDVFLKKHVESNNHKSFVDYAAIKAESRGLREYVEKVTTLSKTDFDSFSEKEKIAFLINSYNALTVKLITDHYPVNSIKDLGSLFSSPWKKKFFKMFGEDQSLDWIEQDVLRKNFSEPRIHVALVCAAKSCPPLRKEPWVASRLDEQFEDAAKNFLTDKDRNSIDSLESVSLSPIFKWYGKDFEKKYGSVMTFVAPRITEDKSSQDKLKNDETKISYMNYDWSLNKK